ncbi:MAG TPA: CCA tRNA nucleotidyltransferase [Allosphingosinicella sp.]
MKLPDAEWQKREGLEGLLGALDAAAGETRYVGGSVRDGLLGLPVSDIDLATRLAPEAVMERLQRAHIKAVPTGIAHGTVTAVLPGGPVEITTLRRDVSTDGRRATVAYTDDWREDAARRDFTINALSADPLTGDVHDYFGGEEDLAARHVRFIGEPLTRIAEDHLRILRFFRFHARFGQGAPDAAALAACSERANDLMALSRERIADELLKLLALPDPAETVALMVRHAIFVPVLPEIADAAPLLGLLERERASDSAPDGLRRLAALLPADPTVATSVAARLRLSRKAAKRLATIAARETKDIREPKMLAYHVGIEEACDRLLLGDAEPAAVACAVRMLRAWSLPVLHVGGGDLIAMGLRPGPEVARTLQAIERAWMERGFPADREAVRSLAREIVDQALRASQ